jgi:hypothetical protein
MKCLTNEQIQQLIDGETSTVDLTEYQQHYNGCSHCKERYNEQMALSQNIKELLNASVQSPERIPEFRIPNKVIKPKLKDIRIISWLEVAALLISVFFVWKMTYKPEEELKPTAENIRMFEKCNNVYANTATWRDNVIIVTDVNGIKVQYADK